MSVREGEAVVKTVTRVYVFTAVGIAMVVVLVLGLSSKSVKADDIFHNAKFQFQQQADLLNTATINVTVHYSCLPPGGEITIDVSQDVVEGAAIDTAVCDGANHTATIPVIGGPFIPGSAAAVGIVSNDSFTSLAEVADEINLR